MKNLYEHGMRTSYDCLTEDMKLSKVPHGTAKRREAACFASVRDMLRMDREYNNDYVRYIKYYPWICKEDRDVEGYMEAVDKYLEVMFQIPFVKERIIEHTGYANSDGREPRFDASKYFLVDMKVPVDEGFSILQMLRIPQEFPGQIKTFHDTLEATGCERTAFVASLHYTNATGTALAGGHAPTNGIDVKWALEFIKDPSIAKSRENKWNSNVMGGGKRTSLRYDDFIQALIGGDPCTINVAVYGSLRKGLGNHGLLDRAIKEKRARFMYENRFTLPVRMYSMGAFPALVPSEDSNPVYFEVYAVNKQTLGELDALEGYPGFYDRAEMLLMDELCWVYYQRTPPSDEVVKSGNWKRYLEHRAEKNRRIHEIAY